MLTKPRWLLHLEGASILVLAIFFYRTSHFSWSLFAILFLAPDLSMLGYLINAKCGAASYNLVHTYAGPVMVLLFSLALPSPQLAVRFDLAGTPGLRPYARLRPEIPHFLQGYAPAAGVVRPGPAANSRGCASAGQPVQWRKAAKEHGNHV